MDNDFFNPYSDLYHYLGRNPHSEGWYDGYHDLGPPDNPYVEGTNEYVEWRIGYDDGSWNS